jgi:hypothetical protein
MAIAHNDVQSVGKLLNFIGNANNFDSLFLSWL